MALLTQYISFFVSPFGEQSVTDELNIFLRSHRIVNVGCRDALQCVSTVHRLRMWKRILCFYLFYGIYHSFNLWDC